MKKSKLSGHILIFTINVNYLFYISIYSETCLNQPPLNQHLCSELTDVRFIQVKLTKI